MKFTLEAAPPGGAERVTLLMLPGAGGRGHELVERGFARCVHRRGLAVDVVAVDARFDDYLENTVVAQLERDVVAPARARGGARIWLMGISLGGLGALSYARERGDVEGVVLIAPFLGTRGLVAEVIRAGGLGEWRPGPVAPDDVERLTLSWLAGYRAGNAALPCIHLGYGTDDRYAPASRMLAGVLPADQVVEARGGHDWETWLVLWERLLDRDLFSRQRAASASPDRASA